MDAEIIKVEDWLEQRKSGIGGSDVAALCGLSPWKTPLQLYMDKIGELPPTEENEAMYWGNTLEDIVAQEFAKRTGKKVRRCNSILRSKKHSFMLANIDRDIVGEDALLEVKTSGAFKNWDNVPEEYMLQIQHYMAVTGYKKAYLAVLIGGNKYKQFEIDRDDALIDTIILAESKFWDNVVNRIPPDISSGDGELIAKMFPEANGNVITLGEDIEQVVSDYNTISKNLKILEDQKEELSNKIKIAIGSNEIGLLPAYQVKYSNVTKESLDTKALKSGLADIYAKYAKSTSYRMLKITNRKDI
jgi:putative phage-type endonuclease